MPRKNSWIAQQVSRGTEATRLVDRKRKTPAGRLQKLYQRGHNKQNKEEINVLSEVEQTTRGFTRARATGHSRL